LKKKESSDVSEGNPFQSAVGGKNEEEGTMMQDMEEY